MKNLLLIPRKINCLKPLACSASLGALLLLAYAPFDQTLLALVILILAFRSVSQQTPGTAFCSAFYFGLGYYGLGISWVFVSVSTFVSPPILAALIALGLVVLMSSFLALSFWFLQRIKLSPEQRLLFLYPLGIVLYEWLITYHLAGFPWLMVGIPMIDLPLGGYAPVFGVMGVGYLLLLSAGLIAAAKIRFYLIAAIIWLVGTYLSSITWVQSEPDRYTVSAIQGNIGISTKWDPQHIDESIQTMVKLTEQHWDSDWIIWSENALPVFHSEIQSFLNQLSQEAKLYDTAVIVGLPIDEGDRYFNSALALGSASGRYDKHHLVPFGEYPPLRDWMKPLLDKLKIPVSDFAEGRERQTLLMLKGEPVALFSCFETIFFEHLKRQLQSAKAIIIISDDGWFGRSFAAYQQSQISRMRAKELGRPIISVGNTGITALIGPDGSIKQSLIPHERDVLTTRLALTHGKTPWVRYGNWGWMALILLCTLLVYGVKKIKLPKMFRSKKYRSV